MSGSPFVLPGAQPAPQKQDWSAAVDSFLSDQKSQATGNLVAAQGVDPEKASVARALSPVVGVPASVMENDPSYWQDQFKLQANQATVGTDANLQKWLAADPENAKISSDDIHQLGLVGRLSQGLSQGWRQGYLQQRVGELGFDEQTGSASPQQEDLLQTFKEQLGQQPQTGGFAAGVGRFLGATGQMFANALPEAATGAVAGGVAGAAAGGVGAIPGAIGGAALGFGAGIAGNAAVQTSGQVYDQLSGMTDKTGKPIPEVTKQAASIFAGVVTGVLANAGAETLSAPVKALVPGLVRDVAMEMATRPTLSRAVGQFAASTVKSGVTGAIINGGMAAAQQIAPQVAEAVSSPDFQTVFNNPEQRQELVKSIADAAEQGAMAFPMFEMPMHGASLWADAMRADAASDNVAKWSALQDGAAESKTRQRAPGDFSGLMAMHTQDAGVPNIYVPGRAIAELYQGVMSGPGAENDPFRFVPDMEQQLSRALVTGGDVEIPTADFTAHLAGTDIERVLRPDIRIGTDAMTAREAEEFRASNMQPIDTESLTDEDAGDVGVDHRGQELQQIEDDFSGQLQRAGFTPNIAEQYAALISARYGARADDFAMSPLDMYQRDNIQVRQDAGRLGPGNYGALDEVIDSLRRGDKMPSDKQLYGESLLDHLSANGGLVDEGGDLKAMDADKWHRGQPGRRKLINPEGESLDNATLHAWEAGYFPNHGERPEINDLLDGIRNELNGNKIYKTPSAEATKRGEFRDLRGQLEQILHERGIDIKTASNADIKAALAESSREYQQRAPVAKISGEEIAPKDADIKTLRDAARKYYADNLRGKKVFNAALDKEIEFRSAKKAFATSANPEKLRLFSALRDVIENGSLVESTAPKDVAAEPSTKAYHFLEAPIQTPDGVRTVGVTIREDSNGHLYYNHAPIEEIRTPGAPASAYNDGLYGAQGEEGKTLKQSLAQSGDDINISLSQPDGTPTGARGSIRWEDGRTLISLFKQADLSTMIHEMGHLFLDQVFSDASREDAPPELQHDVATLRKWLNISDGDAPDIEAHETFARGFETYAMEGKAPSLELRGAFQRFAAWLSKIYRTLAGLGSPISDDIRGVMDRLLATDDAIAEAKNVMGMNPLFRTAEDAGMTAGEFATYTNMIRKDNTRLYDRVLQRAMRKERIKRGLEYKAEANAMRPEMEQQVKSRQVLQAWYLLRHGKDILNPDQEVMSAKVSTEAARDILGAAYARLPRDITATDGMHPDSIAPAFGYSSGEEMLRDLVNENVGRQEAAEATGKPLSLNRWISRLVDQALDDHLQNEFGARLSDDSVEEAALAAAETEGRQDVIAAEMRALGRMAGEEKPPFSVQQVRAWAKDNLAETKINKATNARAYRRAEAKAARDAERALLAKKPVEAFKAKQRQMIAHAFAEEAQRLSDTFDRTTKRWQAVAKSSTRAGTAQPFLDQVHGILDRLGVNVKRDPGELGRGLEGKPLEQFAATWATHGYDLTVPSFLADPRFNQHYADLTADQFEAARDAVASLLRAGRLEEEVTLEGKRETLSDLVDDATDRMAAMPDAATSARLRPERARDIQGLMHLMATGMRKVDASLLKMEQLFSWLDDADRHGAGPFLRMFDRLKQAQHAENDRLEHIAGQWRAMKSKMPKDWAKGLRTRYTIEELRDPQTGNPVDLTKDEIIGMALNVGNVGDTSNMAKLTKGFGWDESAVMATLHRHMTKPDWDFVQGVWDIFEVLAPDIEAMHRRVTGVGFPRVEANPVETKFGTYRGGYFPIIHDAARAPTARGAETADGLFEKEYYRATTSKGHTIGRVEYNAPLKLGLDQISYKLSQVVHDLTHREAIMDAWKFLNRPEVTGAVKRKMGKEYSDLFNPWLRDLANNSNTDDKTLSWLDNGIRRLRLGTSAVQIGFRASTVIKHGTTAMANSVGEVGGAPLVKAAHDLYGAGGAKTRAMVMAKSGELRHRMETFDRDARESLKSLMGESGWITNIRRLGFYPVAAMDMGSAMPTWLAAYRNGLAKGMSDDEAVTEGDRAVRFAHGSGGAADLASIQRGQEWVKALTMFYGFFNHMYNRERATLQIAQRGVRSLRSGDSAGARRDFVAVAGRSLYYLLVPALIEATVSPSPDNANENWFEWGAKAILGQVAAGIPILRDIASSALHGYSLEVTPLQQPIQEAGYTAEDLGRAVGLSDKPVSRKWLQHAIDTAGYATELPLGQAGTAAQYLWDIGDGNADPQDVGSFLNGLMHGAPKN